jgi:hypothetical protein
MYIRIQTLKLCTALEAPVACVRACVYVHKHAAQTISKNPLFDRKNEYVWVSRQITRYTDLVPRLHRKSLRHRSIGVRHPRVQHCD